ncbi:hypothetical protein CBR_g36355 [Chara braunii]|uniref:Major facilitator superfamily (MFS) profile domain-containing protein n=1 Tax=Chara braunii TaxID=69332 RepID=A0A388LKH9_CHABU|nr:hypothetical protein CBR_g36355 [Chara braunii]|eukprot:GBG82824.1 hypothetical protein CBR_g36355 [Chara braunii]
MAGFTLGNMVGLLSAPLLMRVFGNSTGPFIAFGLIGLLWLPLWLTSVTADPRQHPNLDPAELAYITGGGYPRTTEGSGVPGRAGRGGGKGGDLPLPAAGPGPMKAGKASPSTRLLPMSVLLRKPAVWANIVGNVVNNWGFFILLSWMPVYFKKVFGVNLRDAAWFSSGPWAVMAVVGYVAGMIADWMVHDLRMDISTVRKFMQCLGFLGPAIGLTLLRSASRPETASLFLTLSLGLSACSQAGFIVNFQDLGPKHAGLLHGMANTVGTAAGILGTVIAGWLAETTGSFRTVLIVTSIVYAAGAAFWTSFGTAQQLFD